MRDRNPEFILQSEISDLRMRLAHQALEESKKLQIYEKIYEKSLDLSDYAKKYEDIKNIIELAINQRKYEKVHQYCKKIYEDKKVDETIKADFLRQESVAFVAESQLDKAFNRCFKSYKIKRDPKTLSELQIILSKSLGELPTLARAKVEMATTSLNRQDPNFVEINLLYKKIKALKDFEPSFSIRSLEANSLSPSSRSGVEPIAEAAPRVNGAGVFFERDFARRIVPNDLPIARVTANLGFSQPEGQVAGRQNIQENQNIQMLQNMQENQEREALQEVQQVQEIQQAQVRQGVAENLLNPIELPQQQVQEPIEMQSATEESESESESYDEEEGEAQDEVRVDGEAKGKRRKDGEVKKMIKDLEARQKGLMENFCKEFTNLSEEDRKAKQEEIYALGISIKGLRDDNVKLKGRVLRLESDVGEIKDDVRDLEKRTAKNEKNIAKINQRLDQMFASVVRVKTMDELMKAFDEHLAKRQEQQAVASLSEDGDSTSNHSISPSQISDPIAERNAEKDKFYQAQLKAINKNILLSNYFETMVSDLNSFFMASKALQSNIVEQKTPKYHAFNYLKILVNLVPTLGTIGECFAECLEASYKKQKKIVAKENITRFASLAESSSDFEQIAMRLAINYIVDSEVESRALVVRNRLDGQDNPAGIARFFNRNRNDQETQDFYNEEHETEERQALMGEVGNDFEAQETQALLGVIETQIVKPLFERGRNRVVGTITSVGNVLAKKDSLKLIELMQMQELVDEVARQKAQQQQSPVDIRRKPSIIADTILEKFRESNVEPGNENPVNNLAIVLARNVNLASENISETNSQTNSQTEQQEAPSPRASSIYCLAILQKFIGKRK
jgi:hypothetical protein